MVSSTRSSTGNHYIVVLDVAADAVRALLFDSEARRVEGYSAQLPRRPETPSDARADCLDEMHRLIEADGFPVAAVVGWAESEVTAEDRKLWPAFADAQWLPALPEGCGMVLGSGCVSPERFALVAGEQSMLATVVDHAGDLQDGLSSALIGESRRLVYGAVREADGAYGELKRALKVKGSIEGYIENAAGNDPHLARFRAAARRFAEVYRALCNMAGKPCEVVAGGSALLKSPAWTQRIANELGAPLTLSTEAEPACRGAALWALERIGAIESMAALPASTAAVYQPNLLEKQNDT